VEVDGGVPVSCECPADQRYNGACKHRVGVAIRTPVLRAVRISQAGVVTDGGIVESDPNKQGKDRNPKKRCEECIGKFPCWECYRTGEKDFPE
jgi:hypothetical protein